MPDALETYFIGDVCVLEGTLLCVEDRILDHKVRGVLVIVVYITLVEQIGATKGENGINRNLTIFVILIQVLVYLCHVAGILIYVHALSISVRELMVVILEVLVHSHVGGIRNSVQKNRVDHEVDNVLAITFEVDSEIVAIVSLNKDYLDFRTRIHD